MTEAYEKLLQRAGEIHHLGAISGLLAWDQEVFLPPKGVAARARQKATLAALIHERICDPRLGDLITEAAAQQQTPITAANLREFTRHRDRAVKIPRTLVQQLAEVTSLAQQAWVGARQQNDWPLFAPHMTRLVDLKRQEAAAVGYEDEPYDALLDEYEPQTRVRDLAPLFAQLKAALVPLLERIAQAPEVDASVLRQEYPLDRQDIFGREVLADLGFDCEAGRLDTSAHPFTEGVSIQDVRLTTHYKPDDFLAGLYAVIHEAGHGLYEQGLPLEHEGTPLAAAVSLGIHESQSRLWENHVGRSREFLAHYLPRLGELFPAQLKGVTAEGLYRAVNEVKPTLIRIQADEVTYNLHIIVRWELERALLQGELDVAELPAAWRVKMKKYFGLDVPTDGEGALQDIHWAFGAFGYFPTYTLGNLYAAQLFQCAGRELDDLPQQIARGEFKPLLQWLRHRVHEKGCLEPAGDLCQEITGERLQITAFVDHLQAKYSQLYGL